MTVSRVQTLCGMARLGSFMVNRASERQLDEALDSLESLLTR